MKIFIYKIGDFSVYEDALSHIYTKIYSENNVNNDNSQYDVCYDYGETLENKNGKYNKISFGGNVQAKLFKNKTEENQEYLDAGQNAEEQSKYVKELSFNNVQRISSNGINSIFDASFDLKAMKSHSKGNCLFSYF